MSDHAVEVQTAEESPPLLASLGFFLGMLSVLMVATAKLAPLGYMLALPTIVACLVGFLQGMITNRPAKLAIAGFFCALAAIVLWLLARGDITSVAWGRAAWPSWVY
jgi:hypothetical protein